MVGEAHVRAVAPILALVLGCAGLSACGHSGVGGVRPAATAAAGTAHQTGAGGGADSSSADMVAAVSAAKDSGPVDMKFALQQRPAVGQPVALTVQLIPNADLDHLEAHFRADEGLEVREGAQLPGLDHLQTGVPVEHQLLLVPAREGVFSVVATVTTGSATGAVSRSFTIPIIVGAASQ